MKVFFSVSENKKPRSPKVSWRNPPAAGESRACFYCHKPGHLISVCPALKKKDYTKNKEPSAVGLIQCGPAKKLPATPLTAVSKDIDEDFKPFTSHGFLSLPGNGWTGFL